MALSKEIINDCGVATTYHKIRDVRLTDSRLHCALESYVSKEYREVNKSVDTTMFDFNITVEEEESMGIRALCYNKIKETEGWTDAVDC